MAEANPLLTLAERLLAAARRRPRRNYRIPAAWNCWGYRDAEPVGPGELLVEPYRFLRSCLDQVILPAHRPDSSARSLSRSQRRGPARSAQGPADSGTRRPGDWIRNSTIYGTLIRTTSAWDHDGDGELGHARWTETGTFLKTIALLPLLRKLGADTLYLLPVTKCSRLFRKGEVGCPYAAQSFFELEPDLHDRLLGDDLGDLETQFGAFVDAAHALGIRVMVDLAPRTASRDSDLILDHPDWFYWIDRRSAADYGAPRFDGFTGGIPKPSQLPDLFRREELRAHLARFRPAPNQTAPQRWRQFVQSCRAHPPADLLEAIGREFGVITPPGFSDCINDPQPPWSDVTFLRLFLDHPAASARLLSDPVSQPPYVFTDTIKSSKFPGRRPNRPLWDLLADILPFYQRFGIDGARVDMGHALPPELLRMIMERARRIDPDFCFLAEEFNHAEAAGARRAGFNALIGSSWYLEPRADEGELQRFICKTLPSSALPAWAAAETPDTPRAVVRKGGQQFARLAAVLNHFLPNGIPFLNSGAEVLERQPMNLGLDLKPPGRRALPQSDPYYGKLAYFDRVALHWCNRGAKSMMKLLESAAALRRRFLADLTNPRCFFVPRVTLNAQRVVAVGWRVERRRRVLLVIGNLDWRRTRRCALRGLPTRASSQRAPGTLLEIHRGPSGIKVAGAELRLTLEPGDCKVVLS